MIPPSSKRQIVIETIVKPMLDRGWTLPPKSNPDVIAGDYVEILSRFPREVLEKAFRQILEIHKYRNWPAPSVFLEACREFMVDEPRPMSPGTANRLKISIQAREYAQRRMAADNSNLLLRSLRGWFKPQLEEFLFDEACACIHRNSEPYVPHETLEAKIEELEAKYSGVAKRLAEAEEKPGRMSPLYTP